MASGANQTRSEFFKALKPICIHINNLTVRASDKKANSKELAETIQRLVGTLESQISRDGTVMDAKLADYVFFPLSNILRNQTEYPVLVMELTVRCLRTVIRDGWKSKIPDELSQQFLVLFSFFIGGVPGKPREERLPEEVKLEALRALIALLEAAGSSFHGATSLVEAKTLPALGHTISIILDAATGGESVAIQSEALMALEAVFSCIRDRAAMATFLPGTVSNLTRLLAPPAALKTPKKILVKAIQNLQLVLATVLADIKNTTLLKTIANEVSKEPSVEDGKVLTASWLRATADQVKLALGNMLGLRIHGSGEIQSSLERFCITLLDECHQSLAICKSTLVETAMMLSQEGQNESLLRSSLQTSLVDLASIYPELTETIKSIIYDWISSLPRQMQSTDESTKHRALRNLVKGQRLMSALSIDSATLRASLSTSLRDSVIALITLPKLRRGLSEVMTTNQLQLASLDMSKDGESQSFQPVLLNQATVKRVRTELVNLIEESSNFVQQGSLTQDLIEFAREYTGPSQVAAFWLLFELIKSGLSNQSEFDELLDLDSVDGGKDDNMGGLHELYSLSVSILDNAEDAEENEWDWRLQALALEVTTHMAVRMRQDFRPELIDVLYPTTALLGSKNPQLREHSMLSLKSMASACEYSNVVDLIIDNADYMVNSISLRLNTFDISPASTQVLRLMVRLTGPKIVPFLDDVISSIFAALDNYHGYTLLVENLFGVLGEIVQQGSKPDVLLLQDVPDRQTEHGKKGSSVTTADDIISELEDRMRRKKERQEEKFEVEDHPETPWSSEKDRGEEGGGQEDMGESGPSTNEKKISHTPTYTILTRITDLTQHYLTSPTSTLRKSLLDLLATVCPALSPDEDSFLPLVNSIWPVLMERIYDNEPFVVISACGALSALCASAGGFLSSRIKTEWWNTLGKWCVATKAKAKGRNHSKPHRRPAGSGDISGIVISYKLGGEGLAAGPKLDDTAALSTTGGGLGEFTQAFQIWKTVQKLLVAIVAHVRIEDNIFEAILELLVEELDTVPGAREALEAVNADAVWLALLERGRISKHLKRCPVMEEMVFAHMSEYATNLGA